MNKLRESTEARSNRHRCSGCGGAFFLNELRQGVCLDCWQVKKRERFFKRHGPLWRRGK